MSSLKATQADGYYIPPDYTNSGAYKKQSLNQFNTQKSHKGNNQYLKQNTVRFELPYDGLCLSQNCVESKTIKRGTRFNAQKRHVGDYLSSKIWEFGMKCRTCQHHFAIRTNPQERGFDYISGIKRRVEEFDTVENQSLGVMDTEYGHAIHNFTNGRIVKDGIVDGDGDGDNDDDNIIDKLQNHIMGKRKAMTEHDAMVMLMERNHSTMYDDAFSNSNLRAGYRVQRKQKKKRVEHATKLGLGGGILLEGDNGNGGDVALSRSVFEGKRMHHAKAREVQKFRAIRQGIFGKAGSGTDRGLTKGSAGRDANVGTRISHSRKAFKSTAGNGNGRVRGHGINRDQKDGKGHDLKKKLIPIVQKDRHPSDKLSTNPVAMPLHAPSFKRDSNVESEVPSSSLAALATNYGSDSS